jgi:hypothetical protein
VASVRDLRASHGIVRVGSVTSFETALRGGRPREATEGASLGHGIGPSGGPARRGREDSLRWPENLRRRGATAKARTRTERTFVTLPVGHRAAVREPTRSPRPSWDPRLGRTDAGLARRLPFTGMPSASTHVCGSHHTHQSARASELRSKTTRFSSADFTPQERAGGRVLHRNTLRSLTFGANLPALAHEAEWRTVGGRRVAGICHPPITAAYPRTRGFPASPVFTAKARSPNSLRRSGRSRAAIDLATSPS